MIFEAFADPSPSRYALPPVLLGLTLPLTTLTCRSLYSNKLHGAFGALCSSSFVQAHSFQSQNQHYPQATRPTSLPFLTIALLYPFHPFHFLPIIHSSPLPFPVFASTNHAWRIPQLQPSCKSLKFERYKPSQRFASIVITSISPCLHTPHYLLRIYGRVSRVSQCLVHAAPSEVSSCFVLPQKVSSALLLLITSVRFMPSMQLQPLDLHASSRS